MDSDKVVRTILSSKLLYPCKTVAWRVFLRLSVTVEYCKETDSGTSDLCHIHHCYSILKILMRLWKKFCALNYQNITICKVWNTDKILHCDNGTVWFKKQNFTKYAFPSNYLVFVRAKDFKSIEFYLKNGITNFWQRYKILWVWYIKHECFTEHMCCPWRN